MKVLAVMVDDKIARVEDATGKVFDLVTTRLTQKGLLEEAALELKKQGCEAELKEFDIKAPYGYSKVLNRAEGASLIGDGPNPLCLCENGISPMFCQFGHLTECHYPMNCREAECSHLSRYE